MKSYLPPYDQIDLDSDNIQLLDHIYGFNKDLTNDVFKILKPNNVNVWTQYIVNDKIKNNYPGLNFKFDVNIKGSTARTPARLSENTVSTHTNKIDNFLCSFNGAPHVSRQFLTSALYKFNWFDPKYCSKVFITDRDQIDGNIRSYCENDLERFYRKFIIDDSDQAANFYKSINQFDYLPYDHIKNIDVLAEKIKSSFIQLVSETMATSYYPHVSEKFVYPIICQTLWVAYAPPGYHDYLEQYYGFKKYNKIFNYEFDQIENPVIRLVELFSMISKFSVLTPYDWHDLYLTEYDTIQYNYDWYRSQKYLTELQKYAD